MNFDGNSKARDIALSSPAAKEILEQAGVDYCCGGSKSLHEACLHSDTSAEQVLDRLRENAHKASDASGAQWAKLEDLTRHIRDNHHRYVREAIPRLQSLLAKVTSKHSEYHPETEHIRQIFNEVSRDLIMHMQKEEQILFPYIEAVEKSAEQGTSIEPPFFQTVRNPIHAMMREHDAAGELVKEIRRASSDYRAPADGCSSYKSLYEGLQEFEADLHEHVHLENNVLFPRAVELEARLG